MLAFHGHLHFGKSQGVTHRVLKVTPVSEVDGAAVVPGLLKSHFIFQGAWDVGMWGRLIPHGGLRFASGGDVTLLCNCHSQVGLP